MSTRGKTTTTDSKPLYLFVTEERSPGFGYGSGYYHQHARVTTQKYENYQMIPYGTDDTYDGPLYSGLRASCQGNDDDRTRTDRGERAPVYGFAVEYWEEHRIDVRKARRMGKVLERIEREQRKLDEKRGYVRSWGEYIGRLAEILGCVGIGFDRGKEREARTGNRYDWLTVGDGVNRADHLVAAWVEAGQPKAPAAASDEDDDEGELQRFDPPATPPVHCPACDRERGVAVPKACPHGDAPAADGEVA